MQSPSAVARSADHRSDHPQHHSPHGRPTPRPRGGPPDYSLEELTAVTSPARASCVSKTPTTPAAASRFRKPISTPPTTHARAVLAEGEREWRQWTDIELTDTDFQACGDAFERAHPSAVETGTVGVGESKLLAQQPMVDFAVEWLTANRS